jgi:hypothetical protein
MLKPQDLLVAALLGRHPAQHFEPLAMASGLSLSEAHSAVRRLQASDLVAPDRSLNMTLFLGFLESGARFVWPQRLLGPAFGLPTAGAAPVLGPKRLEYSDLPLVWSVDAEASPRSERAIIRGIILEPLYKSMPRAALRDDDVYALAALLEAARSKSARERTSAVAELRRRLTAYKSVEAQGDHP